MSFRRVVASTMTLGALTSAAVLTATAPASAAAGGGQLELCSNGSYASYVVFPARYNWSTNLVSPGQACQDLNIGDSDALEPIAIYGQGPTGPFLVQNAEIRPHLGGNVITYGTPADHWALTPQV